MDWKPARKNRRRRIVARFAWLLLPVALNIYADTPSFNSAVNYAVGTSPSGLISVDLNGDGIADLVTANTNANSISVLIGNGDGTFQAAVDYPVGSAPVQIVVADVNRDGHPDLAVVNSGSYNISILLGRGDGTFKPPFIVSVAPHPPVALAIGDFNGDGNPDLAVVSSNQSVTILLGRGDGSFHQSADFIVTFASPLAITQIVTAKFSSGNNLDLVILNQVPNSVTVLLGNGDGTFLVGQTYGVFGDRPDFLVTADFNHDGFIDLAAGSIAGGVSVLLGNGDGTFSYAQSYPVVGSMGGLVATDIDGDGVPDLVVANADNFALRGYVSVFLGNGDGSFAPPINYPTLYAPSGVVVGDLDHNGHPDLAVATGSASSVSVFLSNAITPQTGFWWNPAESGRGYTIEKQGDNVFMAAYMYDASGRSTWYGVGPAVMIGPSFTAQLSTFSGGQTLTGAWMPPTAGPAAGNITVAFSDATHATLNWPGGTTPIEKFPFVPNGLSLPHAASEPQPGWWWNPKEAGRGFSVEVQGGNLFIASYMYDAAGDPVWYASGPALLVADAFQGDWVAYAGGQTLLGPYQAPAGTANAGNLTLQFKSRTTAVMTLPDGRQVPLQRFSF